MILEEITYKRNDSFFVIMRNEGVIDCFNLAGYMDYQRDDLEPAIKAEFEDFEVRIHKIMINFLLSLWRLYENSSGMR